MYLPLLLFFLLRIWDSYLSFLCDFLALIECISSCPQATYRIAVRQYIEFAKQTYRLSSYCKFAVFGIISGFCSLRFSFYLLVSFVSAHGAVPHTLSRATKYANRSFLWRQSGYAWLALVRLQLQTYRSAVVSAFYPQTSMAHFCSL